MQERDKETDLTVLDDSQLTYFVQKGNEDAFNELISRYISLIKSNSFKFGISLYRLPKLRN